MDRRAFTLQPLIAQGILHPGDNRLSCAVGGIDYFAGKMPERLVPCIESCLPLCTLTNETCMAILVVTYVQQPYFAFVLISGEYKRYPPQHHILASALQTLSSAMTSMDVT